MNQAKDKPTPSPSQAVEAYLAALPDDVRQALEQLRRTIKTIVPDATEGISYQIPSFKYRARPLVAYGSGTRTTGAVGAKGRCSFYLMSTSVLEAHKGLLAGYSTAKGTVHFPVDEPLPTDLVEKLVRARIAENEGRQGLME